MKIKITKKVTDKFTKEAHAVDDIVEKSEERAKEFIKKGYATAADKTEEPEGGDAEKTVSQVKEHVAGVESVDELKELLAAEEAGSKRKGALEAIEKRITELEEPEGGDAE